MYRKRQMKTLECGLELYGHKFKNASKQNMTLNQTYTHIFVPLLLYMASLTLPEDFISH